MAKEKSKAEKKHKTDKFNKNLFINAMFSPALKLKDMGKGIFWPNCPNTKKILKLWKGCNWLLESEYDEFLKFVSGFGASIEIEN